MIRKWWSHFDCSDGGSHPFDLGDCVVVFTLLQCRPLRFAFSKYIRFVWCLHFGLRYRTLRYLRPRRITALVANRERFSIDERSACSSLRITLSPQVIPTPICCEPVSIPMHPSCVAHPVLYNSWMVNGCLHTTEAVFFFSNRRAFLGLVGIKALPLRPITSTLIRVSFLFLHNTGNETVPAACLRKVPSPMSWGLILRVCMASHAMISCPDTNPC